MSTNTLHEPFALLYNLLNPALPRDFIATHLDRLLRTYSTGLTIPIAADEITAAWKSHQGRQKRPEVYTGTITRIVPSQPQLWLIRVQDNSHIAMYPNANFLNRFKVGTTISFAAAEVQHFRKLSDGTYPTIVELIQRTFRMDSAASCGDLASVEAAPAYKERPTSTSPADIAKFPSKRTGQQQADTPSQERSCDDPADRVTSVASSSAHVLFDLASVNPAVFSLSEPIRSFTLQRIWDERSLTPPWIFARVVDIQITGECQVRLQDFSEHDGSDQPSVLWKPPVELKPILGVLRTGFQLLLHQALVSPSGGSFDVLSGKDTICFVSAQPGSADPESTNGITSEGVLVKSPVKAKRRRIDPVLSTIGAVININEQSVHQLMQPEPKNS